MKRNLLCLLLLLTVACGAAAQGPEPEAAEPAEFYDRLSNQDTLTDDWLGFGKTLREQGIEVGLGLTQVYQLNLDGGLATHRRAGRYAGSYDLEVAVDMEKLAGIPGASVYAHAEGSWSDGLSASSVGDLFGVNADAAGDRSIDLTELYWEQSLLGGKVIVRAGKLDLTGGFECTGCAVAFDVSDYASDETSQFLNGALSGNPTIPFPAQGMGAIVYVNPLPGFYAAAGAADAHADARETGFNTAFHRPDEWFYIAETGVVPSIPSPNGKLTGAYRVGMWLDGRSKDKWNQPGSQKRDDVGFYVTVDQALYKENADPEDDQGLGLFARYGFAHDDVNEIECFYSVGGQYKGLLPGRDEDVWGVGFASAKLVNAAGFDKDHESALETYYRIQLTPWMTVSPSFQYIWNPGGVDGVGNAAVVGIRCQITF
ncbi:MAG: carbohydrate porin [Phycisphaerae bacterium]